MWLYDKLRAVKARVFWRRAAFNSLLFKFDALIETLRDLGIWLGGRR